MSEHTPGTWVVEQTEQTPTVHPHFRVATKSGAAVCFIAWRDPPDTGEEQTHARLIAAAPDLLAVCHKLIYDYAGAGKIPPGSVIEDAETAIAKATKGI